MADSRLDNPSIDRDKFRCPICLEEVRDPKDLPCFHTFCKSCIQTYISSTAACTGDQSVKTIECPVCRKSITAPRNDISSEEWASALPQNKLIVSMSVNAEQKETSYCMFCLRNNEKIEAKHWCKTCIETICDDCKTLHLRIPILQNHKFFNLTNARDLNNDIEIDEPCPLHKGKYFEVFCQDHDQLCCSICFATKHRTCRKVEAIEDVAAVLNPLSSQITPTCFTDALKNLEDIQKEYKNKVEKLNARKQEICACTETKIEEIIDLINKAHGQWIKQFNQHHSDAIGSIEIASDEVKRFAMTVREAKTLLQKVVEHGSPKQVFVTRHNVRHQILEHVDRLRNLKIWDVVEDYNQPDTNFLNQVCKDEKFEDVKLLESPFSTMDVVDKFASSLQNNKILQRRAIMAQKDWMKIKLEKVSASNLLSTRVFFGLFVDETKILLSVESPSSLQIHDVTNSTASCVYTHPCSSAPYGLCYSGESMDKVYVCFGTHIEHYQIEINGTVMIKKIETIQLEGKMRAISRGSSVIFARSNTERMICDTKFSVIHKAPCVMEGAQPFSSVSFHYDQQAFALNGKNLVILDENNKEVMNRSLSTSDARGLAFDLQDNVLVCIRSNKLRQMKHGGEESRDIDLPGIQNSYNVVLHPTGEKVMVLDFEKKFCVYNVV
uniref:Uncharacterized protein LOC111106742 n=1 Tax=Crassostrea virginica TaxID=6565 RepID=A0A8B8B1G3_CRAVI|nr:uncharacterized protein LOC111106742 [Crassostrea virginica]